MKAVILAGGLGTRISEETHLKPKPMIEVGGRPIIWHIMKVYSAHGVHDFIICCGYRGYVLKEYFYNYFIHSSDVTVDMRLNTVHIHHKNVEPWQITLIDTGEHTQTGGRLKRVTEYVKYEESFHFTYGDGLADINVGELVAFHKKHGKLATITAVQPPGRYGALIRGGDSVLGFQEKPPGDGAWINGGFFVLSPRVLQFIDGDETSWEGRPLEHIASTGELEAFEHCGFWQPMDTLRDKNNLEQLWASGNAPWKCWS